MEERGVEKTEQREAGGARNNCSVSAEGLWNKHLATRDRRVGESYLLGSTQGVTLGTSDAHLQDPFLFLGDNHQ